MLDEPAKPPASAHVVPSISLFDIFLKNFHRAMLAFGENGVAVRDRHALVWVQE
jgi:hypothetical protein